VDVKHDYPILGEHLNKFIDSPSDYPVFNQYNKRIKELEQEIQTIKNRNIRVEADKAWETSLTRIIIISILTYGLIVLFFIIAKLSEPFINGIIPTLGFILSTLTVPFFKRFWINNIYKGEISND
jgi:hypothetical protein